jgi:hypothetical protein
MIAAPHAAVMGQRLATLYRLHAESDAPVIGDLRQSPPCCSGYCQRLSWKNWPFP